MSIQPLPPSVIAQIKSSATITSLNGVVCELAKNSLDSGCKKIEISIDYAKGACVVEDNGFGVPPMEFREGGGLGKMHHSSNLNSKTPVHGHRGTFLASLSSMALLSITSRHHLHHSCNTIRMHKSEVITRQIPAPDYQGLKYTDHGTRVTVRDLFGNMPVRVKQRAIVAEKYRGNNKDWEDLKRSIVLLLLAWPEHASVTIQEVGTLQKLVIRGASDTPRLSAKTMANVPRICNILSQTSLISPDESGSWVGVSVSTDQTQINGTISLDPSATKHNQFISFGIHPVAAMDGQSMLHDEVNRLFLNSAFGNDEEAKDLNDAERRRRTNDARYNSFGYTNRELKGGRKGVDRWPMFYLNIEARQESAANQFNVHDILLNKKNSLGAILELLQAMIFEFMTQHYFRPKSRRKNRIQREGEANIKKNFQNRKDILNPADLPRAASAPHCPTAIPESSKSRSFSSLGTGNDLLGINVKLPSFRSSSSQMDSPFDSWTKVKRGSGNPEKAVSKYMDDRPVSSIHEIEKTGSRSCSRIKLLSASGKVIRRPFEETEISAVHPRNTIATSMVSSKTVHRSDNDDNVVEWINPTTKVKTLVNQRTGHSVTAKPIRPRKELNSMVDFDNGRITTRPSSRNNPTAYSDSSPWITGLLKRWENPVFTPAETSIPEVSIGDFDGATQDRLHGHNHVCFQEDIDWVFKDSSKISNRISRDSLRHAKVISQVDKKFILVKLGISGTSSVTGKLSDAKETLVVIIDQHAADERIRIEALMEELCTPNDQSVGSSGSPILTTRLEKILTFEISPREAQLLHNYCGHFSRWGIVYELTKYDTTPATHRVQVGSLPPSIAERCKVEPRLLIELIRKEAWKCAEIPPVTTSPPPTPTEVKYPWLNRIHNCPKGLLDMLNSRACRSAIMFNDVLSLEQCEVLVKKLANCAFPFQCAHGRPSLVPLIDLRTLGSGRTGSSEDERNGGGMSFGEAFGKWKGGVVRT